MYYYVCGGSLGAEGHSVASSYHVRPGRQPENRPGRPRTAFPPIRDARGGSKQGRRETPRRTTQGYILVNSFGTASNQYPLYDVRGVIHNRRRFGRGPVAHLYRANSLYCSVGRCPSRGWILLSRKDYDKLDRYSTSLRLTIGDANDPDNVGVIKNLSVVQAQCVTRGIASDANAIYLIELTDGRGVLDNQWFKFPITKSYNVRAPAYPQTFFPDSMNGGTTWTWSTMLQDIWESMGTFLGTWPGLPYAPAGTPEGFWLQGAPAFRSMCDILDHLGMTIACDLTSNSPFTIVDDGASDASLTALQSSYVTNLEDDIEWIDIGAGRVPKTIKVIFRRRNSVYGTEETVRYDSYQWSMSPIYTVSVTAPATFSSAVGTHYIVSDFTVRYDADGTPLAEDVATATTIASERVDQYFDKVYSGTSGYMDKVYAGALPFKTGSQVDGVRWYQDYAPRSDLQPAGWRTQIVRRNPVWPEINENGY